MTRRVKAKWFQVLVNKETNPFKFTNGIYCTLFSLYVSFLAA